MLREGKGKMLTQPPPRTITTRYYLVLRSNNIICQAVLRQLYGLSLRLWQSAFSAYMLKTGINKEIART
jgi:hypothetical protein